MINKGKYRVLVCPLGWGLGHASRLVPVIAQLQNKECEVIIAGDNLQLKYLLTFFPGIENIHFPSFSVRYAKGSVQIFPIIRVALILPFITIREHLRLKKIIRAQKIQIVISDNRYGLWHKDIKTVIITHQLKVIPPKPFSFLESLITYFIKLIICKYDYCWVPDYSGEKSISGKLSHVKTQLPNIRFIGLLSRFQGIRSDKHQPRWDLVGISSGPSPQREIFIKLLETLAYKHNLRTLIIKGNPLEGNGILHKDLISYAGHLENEEFAGALFSTRYLITRSGYSTIMDLLTLGISCLIIPTPGQTEQEYLSLHLSEEGFFNTCNQSKMEDVDISYATVLRTEPQNTSELLCKAIQEVIS